jgi:hypothetical protein
MKNMEWTFFDKSDYPDGPWKNEPDKMQWTDEITGMPCLMHRSEFTGALCGYVGVTEKHPLFQMDPVKAGEILDVHGGITFGSMCAGMQENGNGICHVADAGEPDHLYWFGFDCSHYEDFQPRSMMHSFGLARMMHGHVYRDIPYIKEQCALLARQLYALYDCVDNHVLTKLKAATLEKE